MTFEEQDRVDHAVGRWVVFPGHEPRGGRRWRVVEETDRFVVFDVEEQHQP
jgi:hypothetical protein